MSGLGIVDYNNVVDFMEGYYLMTTSIEGKENSQVLCAYRPVHQGRAFRIELGHSNGPYLSKDVMHSNQKSTYLLAAKQVLESHKSMASLMVSLSKEEQNQSKLIRNSSRVESWFSKCDFIEEELRYMSSELKKLTLEENRLKVQVKLGFARLLRENEQLHQSFIPLFKNLLKCVRDQNSEEKNLFEEKKRDLEQLHNFRNQYLDELVTCERRIIKIEQFLGVEQPESEDQ